jgi:hypothetical protein
MTYTAAAPAGSLAWSKPQTSGTFFASPFAAQVNFQAGVYQPPALHHQVLGFTNTTKGVATVTLSGGGVATISHSLSVSADNVVTVTDPGTDKLALKIVAATGALSGTFVNPANTRQIFTLSGVIDQQLPQGAEGVFVGTAASGSLSLTPQ